MRTIINFIILFQIVFIGGCGTVEVKNDAKIVFETIEYDFGELNFKGQGNCIFKFTNTSKTALFIHDVESSCGCTVPAWTKKPILPGKTGEIKIVYDTSHPGVFNKTIAVFYNGIESPQTLILKGTVRYPGNYNDKKEL